ncbi:MAG: thiamine phosphate synthase [Alicyclobacillaceae bacterium]|nr:thiamine phosphate synthase [Alicyclobacillaceae bacterium]
MIQTTEASPKPDKLPSRAVLHVLSDRSRHRLPLLSALTEAARGGADVIQVREKRAPAADVYQFCEDLRKSCQAAGLAVQLFVNDRLDVAMAAAADGVHLAAKSLPVAVARKVCRQTGWQGLIGCSVHSLEEALAAEQAGADYVTFGHVYASESHPGLPPRGVRELARIVDALHIPVVAIGGITAANAEPVLQTGCSGIAVIGAVLDQDDPCAAARTLREAVERIRVPPKVPFPLGLRARRDGTPEHAVTTSRDKGVDVR